MTQMLQNAHNNFYVHTSTRTSESRLLLDVISKLRKSTEKFEWLIWEAFNTSNACPNLDAQAEDFSQSENSITRLHKMKYSMRLEGQ